MSIALAVRQGDVRSIIYINNPGSLQAFTKPENTVRVLPVLDAIERDYPELAGDVKVYRRPSAGLRRATRRESLIDRRAPLALGQRARGLVAARLVLALARGSSTV